MKKYSNATAYLEESRIKYFKMFNDHKPKENVLLVFSKKTKNMKYHYLVLMSSEILMVYWLLMLYHHMALHGLHAAFSVALLWPLPPSFSSKVGLIEPYVG